MKIVAQEAQLSLFSDDLISTQEFISQIETEKESVELSISKWSMPVIQFTFRFLDLCKEEKLGRIDILLALSMLGNMNAKRGFIHKFKVKDKAKELGCSETQLYKSLRRLKESGFGVFTLRYGTVKGTLAKEMLMSYILYKYQETEEITEEDLKGHAMPVGMIYHLELEVHIKAKTSAAHLRLMMAGCLNCDVQTGELHEKRPSEWGELAGLHRTWCVEGFERANEIGTIQTKTDYDVVGRMPFVALANGHFRVVELAKEGGRRDPKDWVKQKLTYLYEGFGLQLTGLAHDIIERAWIFLGAEADKILAEGIRKTEKIIGRKLEKPVQLTRIFEGAERDTIPSRDELPFA